MLRAVRWNVQQIVPRVCAAGVRVRVRGGAQAVVV